MHEWDVRIRFINQGFISQCYTYYIFCEKVPPDYGEENDILIKFCESHEKFLWQKNIASSLTNLSNLIDD